MAAVRAGLTAKSVTKARERAASLGLELTVEQAVEAAARILKTEQAERAAQARIRSVEAAKEGFTSWAVGQALRYGDTLNAYEPTIPLNACKRLCLMAVDDELEALDGYSRPRLLKRLDLFLERAREAMQATTDRLDASIVADPPREWHGLEVSGEWQTSDDSDGL